MSRKSKPKFELPEGVTETSAAGWVRRDDDATEAAIDETTETAVDDSTMDTGPLLTLPVRMFAFGLETMGRMMFGMARLMIAPLDIAGRLWSRRDRR